MKNAAQATIPNVTSTSRALGMNRERRLTASFNDGIFNPRSAKRMIEITLSACEEVALS